MGEEWQKSNNSLFIRENTLYSSLLASLSLNRIFVSTKLPIAYFLSYKPQKKAVTHKNE